MAKAANSLSADDILNRIKRMDLVPVYLLHGEEPYYIDVISNYFEHEFLNEMEKAFNQTVVYGRDTDVFAVINAARRYPMMAERQLVLVKEAQDLKQIDMLLPYLENPLPSTILVICYKHKKMDGRSKMLKLAKDKFVAFESAMIPDYKIDAWVEQYCRNHKIAIQPMAIGMLTEFLGNDLSKIANEIDKLLLNIKGNTEITAKDVEKFVGVSKEFNTFELQKAVAENNFVRAQKIVHHFGANPKESIVPVLAILFNFFSRLLVVHNSKDYSERNISALTGLPPFLAREYVNAGRHYPMDKCVRVIGYLHEFDLKSKGIGSTDTPQGSMLKELVYRIMKM